jgi:hypothetical protein
MDADADTQTTSKGSSPARRKSGTSVEESGDDVLPIPPRNGEEYEADEKTVPDDKSFHLHKTASNVLSRVTSGLTTHSLRDPGPPPNGGLKAWTQVGCTWIVLFTTWGYVNSFGSFQTYYASTLQEAPSTISWIGSVQVWLTFFIGAFSGRMLDAGYFIPTFIVGAVLQLLGIFMMSISHSFWSLMLTQGVLTGIGGGIFFTPSMGLLSTYWSTRRGVAIGIATTGNSAGGMIYPVIVRELLPKIGFAWTARVLGFVNLGCLCVVLAFMRPRLPPRATGPLIDWKAFTEPVYMLFVGGIWFAMWVTYWMFYYVRAARKLSWNLHRSLSTTLTLILPDCFLRRRCHRTPVRAVHHSDHCSERRRLPCAHSHSLFRRRIWTAQHSHPQPLRLRRRGV